MESERTAAVLFSADHWTDPGGQSLGALEAMIEQYTSKPHAITELQLVATVEEMRDLCFPGRIVPENLS